MAEEVVDTVPSRRITISTPRIDSIRNAMWRLRNLDIKERPSLRVAESSDTGRLSMPAAEPADSSLIEAFEKADAEPDTTAVADTAAFSLRQLTPRLADTRRPAYLATRR